MRRFMDPMNFIPPCFRLGSNGGYVTSYWGDGFEYMYKFLILNEDLRGKLLVKLEMAFKVLDHDLVSGMWLKFRDNGFFLSVYPGDRSELYMYDTPGATLSTHNVDNPQQTVALWMMASIICAEIMDNMQYEDTVEELQTKHPLPEGSEKFEIQYEFGSHYPTTIKLHTFVTGNSTFYVFAGGCREADDVATRELGRMFEAPEVWNIQPLREEELPKGLLVSFRLPPGMELPPDEDDDEP